MHPDKDDEVKKILQKSTRKGMRIPLLPERNIVGKKKMKLYSAEEALAERKRREAKQKPIVINSTFLPPKPSKPLLDHDVKADMLLKFAEPLEREQQTMLLQAMRYIIGPSLDHPPAKLKQLFGWLTVKRHPITNIIDKELKFKVFYFFGDRIEDMLKNKTQEVALIWHRGDLPQLREDKDGKVIGLVNNWEYLFDDDSEYEGDKE